LRIAAKQSAFAPSSSLSLSLPSLPTLPLSFAQLSVNCGQEPFCYMPPRPCLSALRNNLRPLRPLDADFQSGALPITRPFPPYGLGAIVQTAPPPIAAAVTEVCLRGHVIGLAVP